VQDAVQSTMVFADKEHWKRVNLLEQAHQEKLMALAAISFSW
jgi:hypothetical protein